VSTTAILAVFGLVFVASHGRDAHGTHGRDGRATFSTGCQALILLFNPGETNTALAKKDLPQITGRKTQLPRKVSYLLSWVQLDTNAGTFQSQESKQWAPKTMRTWNR